jgi:hypothetical protein
MSGAGGEAAFGCVADPDRLCFWPWQPRRIYVPQRRAHALHQRQVIMELGLGDEYVFEYTSTGLWAILGFDQ